MKNLLLVLSLSLVACSGKKEANEMTKLADAMCACKDVDCAEKLFPQIEKFTTANEGKQVEASAADEYNRQIDRTEKCYTKLHDDAAKNAK